MELKGETNRGESGFGSSRGGGNGGGSLCDEGKVASYGDAHAELDTASFFRWSMKT